jgi:aryl-alcohol dehydrogenase-like predicted oxidoreductase
VSQVEDNVAAADLPALSGEQMARIQGIYSAQVRPLVHHRW